jgi:predicted acetyltransferase
MRPLQNRLLFCDGVLASALTVYLWRVRLNGLTPLAGLIGGVCTHPDYRRRGFVKLLMQDAVDFMKGQGCSLSWLYGKEHVYSSSGYRTFKKFPVLSCQADNQILPPTGLKVRPVNRSRDVSELMKIYEYWNSGLSGPILRSREDWEKRVIGSGARKGWDRFSIAEENGQVIGYFQIMKNGAVGEFGAADEASAVSVMNALAEKTGGRINFNFSCKKLEDSARSLPGTRVSVEHKPHGMWQLFDGEGAGLSAGSSTGDLLNLLESIPLVYYQMDRF